MNENRIFLQQIPSVHSLQCSHCDLYHIAARPERIKNWIESSLSAQRTLFIRVIPPPNINPLRSNPSSLFSCARVWFLLRCRAEIVPEGVDHESLGHHSNHTVFTTIPFTSITEQTHSKSNEAGVESHFNECFNLALVPLQRRAPYQRWMASLLLPLLLPSAPPLGSAERSYSGVIHYIWLWK